MLASGPLSLSTFLPPLLLLPSRETNTDLSHPETGCLDSTAVGISQRYKLFIAANSISCFYRCEEGGRDLGREHPPCRQASSARWPHPPQDALQHPWSTELTFHRQRAFSFSPLREPSENWLRTKIKQDGPWRNTGTEDRV